MGKLNYKIFKLDDNDYRKVLKCLGNGDIKNVEIKDRHIVKNYFEQYWIGYGAFIENPKSGLDNEALDIIGYCFIKYPKKRPETLTVVRSDFRNQGIATDLRNFAINQRKFKGHIVYSAVKYDNLSSFKSIIKSGFQVFDITKDGYVQLMKVLKYK